ncbi:MAG TPA: alpha/beta hydrolase [Candidatus Acidoferrum sp.]|jgi:pimeloyl-ACP methyl ester carboxylesterase|nr:alpha/beta hydrolase [Candidatus Acidoferrum sp.]
MDFESDGIRLHYEVHGPEQGAPLVVVHGFASDYRLNWVGTRWQEALTTAGFRVFGLDCRGHGQSDKPHDSAAYAIGIMGRDVTRLLDHLEVPSAGYLGYSMGARIGLQVVMDSPDRVRRAVLGGIGASGSIRNADAIAAAFLTREPGDNPIAQSFYRFASARPTNDLKALAACIKGLQPDWDPARLSAIQTPVLVVVGDRDELAPDAPELVELMPSSRLVTVQGRDHMGAVPAREFKQAAIDFLSAE